MDSRLGRRAPLTYSQLNHWQLYHVGGRPGFRNVVRATHLRGPVHSEVLRAVIAKVVGRHDALRTRIAVEYGAPVQVIDKNFRAELQINDLRKIGSPDQHSEILRQIDDVILEPIVLSQGPLWGARLLLLGDDEFAFILGLEHIISDAVSLDILLREILTAYGQVVRGCAPTLPEVLLQFSDYAVRQAEEQSAWATKHNAYWYQHLRGCRRVRFPQAHAADSQESGWGVVPLHLDGNLRSALCTWCRSAHTSLALGIFTTYAALVMRWCGVAEAVIRYQGNGRNTQNTSKAVGFFASRLYLRLNLLREDRFEDLLSRVVSEYCSAYEHDDFGSLETRTPQPEC
ncbi:MAG TPA: condensation domain-containing protein, partial [Steroidobacteraceae bacterium]